MKSGINLRMGGLLAALLVWPAEAQQVAPADSELSLQSVPLRANSTAPERKGAGSSGPRKTEPVAKANPGRVSISSELKGGSTAAPAPSLGATKSQPQNPWDQRVPFGPLSLGLQTDTSPRSNAQPTPLPSGMEQYRKDRVEPYVGLSIIDIKR